MVRHRDRCLERCMESAFLEIPKPRLDKVLSGVINFDIGLVLSRAMDQMTYRSPVPPIIFCASS